MVSSNASLSYAQIAEARLTPDQPLFFQLYKHRDNAIAAERVREVVALGYNAIFLTVDAIVAGNREDAAKHVRVRALVGERELVLEVQDEGAGFDLAAELWGPDAGDAHEREDGRGLFLMRRLMDHVEQWVAPGRGNVVRMTLRRSA